ncbi:ABC transporter ATP-binding protein [Devosia oryzisoli]|nr:ABC transporter ATP-binding protein [Devosia oryzisoli]
MTAEPNLALEINGLSVALGSAPDAPRIIHDVNLTLARGECVGVVGESGCGKTVSFLATMGLLPGVLKVSGSARLAGQEMIGVGERQLERIRGRKVGMIFQDPQSALNPVRTIGAQLMEPLRLHLGMTRAAAEARAIELLTLVGIPAPRDRLRAYPHEISGGTCQRVMIAVALASEPEVLIADEPTTALDATVQLQVLDLLRSIQAQTSLSIIFITHDLGVVAEICDRVVVMYAGRTVEVQDIPGVFSTPHHPYTRALLDCLPALEIGQAPPRAISGDVPMPGRAPSGCPFHPRCSRMTETCRVSMPAMQSTGPGPQGVACYHPLQETV